MSQQLVMTPQLQQAIQLLTLSNLEVEAAVAAEVERNPLLAFEGEEGSSPGKAEVPEDTPGADMLIAQSSGDAPLDVDHDVEIFHHDCGSDSGATPSGEAFDFERVACGEGSLCEHLMAQAGAVLAGTDLVVARVIVDALEETGYLAAPLAEIADGLGMPVGRVERVLEIVQSFDPPGVAARSLAECLALQARAADRLDPAMARLLANLPLLGRGDLRALRRICGVDDEDLRDMIAEVRSYDPKPGCRFDGGSGGGGAIVPDLFVTRTREGWSVELNGATLPRLLVDRRYHARLIAGGKASKAFAADCLDGANWLLKALDQRANTILKVGTELVRRQEAFFAGGVAGLRPLTMARIADAVGVHESTVGRVVSAKYLGCERGLFELKYFFTSGVQGADGGEAASALSVKSRIRALIMGEAGTVLSDDTLVDLLHAEGFDLARRTVAKYREACGIGSSVRRRRQKAIDMSGG